jgi:lipopolysaccharide transport system permease protein
MDGTKGVAVTPHHALPFVATAAYLWDLLLELVSRDIRLRFKRSLLGILWSLVTPLVQLVVLRFVFTTIVPLDIPDFTAFLFIGLIVWAWLQSSLDQAASSIVDNGELVRLAGFPVAILPVVTVAANLIELVLALPVLGIFLWRSGGAPLSPALLLLPVLLAVQFLLILSVAYFVAALQVTFRDVKHLLGVGLMLGFYLSPVFYQVHQVPPQFARIYILNPMVHLMGAYRDVLLHGRLPAAGPLVAVALASAMLLILGYRLFARTSASFVDEL